MSKQDRIQAVQEEISGLAREHLLVWGNDDVANLKGYAIFHPYVHYKGGIYHVLDNPAMIESTGDACVAYTASGAPSAIFIRPASEFFGTVEVEGETVPRFKPLSEADLHAITVELMRRRRMSMPDLIKNGPPNPVDYNEVLKAAKEWNR